MHNISTYLIVYATTAAIFFVIDLIWLGVVAKKLYHRHLGHMLREDVNWTAAILFYLVYILGIQVFVLMPTLDSGAGPWRAAALGGFLGFFAYCTFDLTSLALIRNWPLKISIIDIAWGVLLTGGTSAMAIFLIKAIM